MLLHIDGFDSYLTGTDLAQEYLNQENIGVSTNSGRFGGGCLAITYYNQSLTWASTAPNGLTNFWIGFAMQVFPTTSNGIILQLATTVGIELKLLYNVKSGVWSIQNISGGLNEVISYPVTPIAWHWLDINLSLSGTTLWLDNVFIFNYNNVVSEPVYAILIGDPASAIWPMNLDDLYILDETGSINNKKLGDSLIQALVPNADAGPNDGTPSTPGAHYRLINENFWSTSNAIIMENTTGQEEAYNLTSLPSGVDQIYGIKLVVTAKKFDVGTMFFNLAITSNTVVSASGALPMITTYAHINEIFETDPATANAWTISGIDNITCSITVIA